MMSLGAKLSLRSALARLPSPRHEPLPLPASLGALEDGVPLSIEQALPGQSVMTEHGATWRVTARHPLDLRHGTIPLGRACGADYRHLERMTGDARLKGFDPRQALFLDIETTGLQHGAGTVAFLVGLAFFEGDQVQVQQLILRDPDEEAALLSLVWDAVQRFPYLVSFNGKSFDMSILQSRMVMQHMCSAPESQLKLRPHLDLLHVSRSVYKGLWPDVRLQTLEREVLGLVRHDDLPGALAPLCWFTWLRDADARPLAGIAHHNQIDVLSMVALAGVLAQEAEPRADAGRRSRVALNLARLYLRRRAPVEALAVLADWPPLMDHDERISAIELTITAARRLGATTTWVAALERLVNLCPERTDVAKVLGRARRKEQRDSRLVEERQRD